MEKTEHEEAREALADAALGKWAAAYPEIGRQIGPDLAGELRDHVTARMKTFAELPPVRATRSMLWGMASAAVNQWLRNQIEFREYVNLAAEADLGIEVRAAIQAHRDAVKGKR